MTDSNEIVRQCAILMASGLDFDEAYRRVLQNKPFRPTVVDTDRAALPAIPGYSLQRAILCQLEPSKFGDCAGLERDVSDQIARQLGAEPRGLFVPTAVLGRDLSAGTATDGAELVGTNVLGGQFIDVLRARLAVARAGARIVPGLVGNAALPRKTSGSTAGWIATEGGNAAQSEPQFDQVTLTPKTVGAYGEYTRQLLKQSTPGVEGLLRSDLASAIATAIDVAALEGSGASGQPTGLRNASGVLTSTIAVAGAPTWVEIVEFMTDLDAANALAGNNLGWIVHPGVRGSMLVTEKATGTAKFILEARDELAGFPLTVTSNAAANGIYFGDWSQLLIGMWGGLDVLVDPYSNSQSGTVRISAFQSVDIAVRHPEAFAINSAV